APAPSAAPRFEPAPAPIAASRFDSGPALRPPAAQAPPSRPVSSAQVSTPPAGPLTPVPATSHYGASRFGSAEPPRPLVPPAPTRASLARSAPPPARALPTAVPASVAASDSIPEALPFDESDPGSRFPGGLEGQSWDETKKAGGVSVFLVFLITALVTT